MLNRNWILNFKDTNNIQQAGRAELPLMCALCCRSHRSHTLVCARWGQWSITRRKWPLALILISAGLEQISLHLSPISAFFKQQLPLQSSCLEAPVLFREILGRGDTTWSRYEKSSSFPLILFTVWLCLGNIKLRPKAVHKKCGSITDGCKATIYLRIIAVIMATEGLPVDLCYCVIAANFRKRFGRSDSQEISMRSRMLSVCTCVFVNVQELTCRSQAPVFSL